MCHATLQFRIVKMDWWESNIMFLLSLQANISEFNFSNSRGGKRAKSQWIGSWDLLRCNWDVNCQCTPRGEQSGSKLLLLLKPAAEAQVGKTKLFINCLRNPTSTCATEILRNKLREATNDLLLPSTHRRFRCQIQCKEGHSTHESRGRIIKTLVKLQCSAPCSSRYNMKATMCQQCCKPGSSKIYKFIVGRLYLLLRRAHCSQHVATYNI